MGIFVKWHILAMYLNSILYGCKSNYRKPSVITFRLFCRMHAISYSGVILDTSERQLPQRRLRSAVDTDAAFCNLHPNFVPDTRRSEHRRIVSGRNQIMQLKSNKTKNYLRCSWAVLPSHVCGLIF